MLQTVELGMLQQQYDSHSLEALQSSRERKEELMEKVEEIGRKIKEVKGRKITYEYPGFKYSTEGDQRRTRMVGVVSTHQNIKEEKEGREQMERMKDKMNELLRTVEGRDGVTPFGFIENFAKSGHGWIKTRGDQKLRVSISKKSDQGSWKQLEHNWRRYAERRRWN